MQAFLADYPAANERASALDNIILQNATAISSQYADLVSLAARQAFAGTEISVSTGSDGNPNASDVKIFMKDIGNSRYVFHKSTMYRSILYLCVCRRVNPVEVLYASFSMFLYFNTSFGGPLLSPLLEYQDSSQYTNSYAAADLGRSFTLVLALSWRESKALDILLHRETATRMSKALNVSSF